MAADTLLLVESPAKAKKLQQYLGAGFRVQASFGHICDLPKDDYGVDTDTFEEEYEVYDQKRVRQLQKQARKADRVVLATDPDREGEAISWHLARELNLNPQTAQRCEFRSVTQKAVQEALENPRTIDMDRVDAQRSRRILDRIVGFDVSEQICWPANAQSAGRVQTPALHLLCEREREILNFVPEDYWVVGLDYQEGLSAVIPRKDEDKEEDSSEDREQEDSQDDEGPGKIYARHFKQEELARKAVEQAQQHDHIVRDTQKERRKRYSGNPYTTSTLQQDASRKLNLSAARCMDLAQALFDNGFITYHRTDSTRVSPEGIELAREYIQETHPEALPDSPPSSRKSKGAQDAHEAIRPTALQDESVFPEGSKELYEMIKARFLASQCKPAELDRTTIWIDSGPVGWAAQGSVLVKRGFLHFWAPYARVQQDQLPDVESGQKLTPETYDVEKKQTQPPSRYDTGSLVKKLESSGVGRPSTFASIIDTLLNREYVEEVKQGSKEVLKPTEFGLKVDQLLETTFPNLVLPDYTAAMENRLDQIEEGNSLTKNEFLEKWYNHFREQMEKAKPKAQEYIQEHGVLREDLKRETTDITCDRCNEATYQKIERKNNKGWFLGCPNCSFTRNLEARIREEPCPECGSTVIERQSRKGTPFWGCVRYGADQDPCDYATRIAVETDILCNRCKEITLVKHPGPGGKSWYLACPKCEFTRDVETVVREKACPECDSDLIKRTTQKGTPFWGCVRYGAQQDSCDHTEPVAEATDILCNRCKETQLKKLPRQGGKGVFLACPNCRFRRSLEAEVREEDCPQCGSDLIERQTKEGAPFWGCVRYGAQENPCEYAESMAETVDKTCNRCQEAQYHKVPRKNGQGHFLSCPACNFNRNLEARTRKDACPECGGTLIEKKSTKGTPFWGCVYYQHSDNPCSFTAPMSEETDQACERCGEGTYRKIEGQKGKVFLSCSSCRFTRDPDAKVKKDACPKCGSTLVERRTRDGNRFMGCVRYGLEQNPCDYTEDMEGEPTKKYEREKTDKPCPKCERHNLLLIKPLKEKYGNAFYACEDQDCSFHLTYGAKKRQEPCPECGGTVVERRKRDGTDPFWSCSKYPDCKFTQEMVNPD